MEKKLKRSFESLFYPGKVAVFGSVKEKKIGNQVITQMLNGNFKGEIFAVNPKGEKPEGYPSIPGMPDINEVQGGIDLAIITVPARFVAETLEKCGSGGVPIAVVLSSGFSEVGNIEGERRITEVSREFGIRVIGPNCAGIMNTKSSLFASIEVKALPGSTGFITQSGAVGGAVLAMAENRGIGFSKFVSYGNRADIGELELLEYLADDEDTDVIAMYIESIDRGFEFLRIAGSAAQKKPFILIKSGRSGSGMRAASSHTGSMAGSDAVFDAAFKQLGIIRAAGIEEMLDLCDGFNHLPRLSGRDIAIITNSGGPGILTADRAEEFGLSVPEPGLKLKSRLRSFLSENCSLGNPVDLTVEGSGLNFKRAIDAMIEDKYSGVIAINVATPFLDSLELARGITGAGRGLKVKKPVAAVFMAGEIVEEAVEFLKQNNVPVFPTGERAAFVFSKLFEYYSHKHRAKETEEAGEKELPLTAPVLEPEAAAFLKEHDFPVPECIHIKSKDELEHRAGDLSFPLVMKVVSPEIIHKSDSGGVVLNIESMNRLRDVYPEIERKFSDRGFRGVLLYEQILKGVETIVGMKRDPLFGPVIIAGAGGVLAELIRDISIRIAPVDKLDAEEMISALKINKLLSGFRGGPECNRKALAELIVMLSQLSLEYPSLLEIDLNPVFVSEKDVVIADVRIIVE